MNSKGNGKASKKKKKGAAKSGGSLLSRFFKGGAKAGRPDNGTAKKKVRAKPLTPLERSIQEIKNMAKVGESNPERLAMLLSRLLGQEKEKERLAKEDFDRMVWDIVDKNEAKNADDTNADGTD